MPRLRQVAAEEWVRDGMRINRCKWDVDGGPKVTEITVGVLSIRRIRCGGALEVHLHYFGVYLVKRSRLFQGFLLIVHPFFHLFRVDVVDCSP